MLECQDFYDLLVKYEIDFFTGVPDSLMKHFCSYLADKSPEEDHIIAANEGAAIAIATGYHLATKKVGLVYMQNSGLGNAVNPLTSLTDPELYSIPTILLIGWRAEPGMKDEPQHKKKGKITLKLLETLDIPYHILPKEKEVCEQVIKKAKESALKRNAPHALVVQKETFSKYKRVKIEDTNSLSREDAIKCVVDQLAEDDVVVSTTGKISRELFEYREKLGQSHKQDFMSFGAMGHCSQIALGIAEKKNKRVICLDGDGSLIMHMGSLAIIGIRKPKQFVHIVLNNGTHDSVGGQPTVAHEINIPAIAKACGYQQQSKSTNKEELKSILEKLDDNGPHLIEVVVNRKSRADLGRPTTTPIENKKSFMEFLNDL